MVVSQEAPPGCPPWNSWGQNAALTLLVWDSIARTPLDPQAAYTAWWMDLEGKYIALLW